MCVMTDKRRQILYIIYNLLVPQFFFCQKYMNVVFYVQEA